MSRYNVPAIPLDALEAAVDLGNDIAALQINDTDWDDVLAGLREEISKLSVEELESIEPVGKWNLFSRESTRGKYHINKQYTKR